MLKSPKDVIERFPMPGALGWSLKGLSGFRKTWSFGELLIVTCLRSFHSLTVRSGMDVPAWHGFLRFGV